MQLDYERERRERLESQLDEYRREITYLNDEIDRAHADAQVRRVTSSLQAPAMETCVYLIVLQDEQNAADRRKGRKKTVKKRPSSAPRRGAGEGAFVMRGTGGSAKRSGFASDRLKIV